MAESQAKIRLTMDGQQAIREADKLKNKTKEAAEASSVLGRNWREGGATIAKMVVGVTAIVAGLRAAAQAAADLRREQGEAYNKQEAASRNLAAAERRAGLKPGFARTVQTRSPNRLAFSTEQATEVIDAAREANVTSPAEIERALNAYGSGYFDKGELFDKRRRRAIGQNEIDARFNVMDVGRAREARIRRQEEAFNAERFGEQGANEAVINASIENRRREGGIQAAIVGVQPDFLNRMQARQEEAIKDIGRRFFSRPIKVESTKPQTGSRD